MVTPNFALLNPPFWPSPSHCFGEVSSKTYSRAACSPQEAWNPPAMASSGQRIHFNLAGWLYIYMWIILIYIYIYWYRDTIYCVEKNLISESRVPYCALWCLNVPWNMPIPTIKGCRRVQVCQQVWMCTPQMPWSLCFATASQRR